MLVKPEDITPDKLDEVAAEWDTERLWAVTRAEIIVKSNQWHAARVHESQLETQCMIRARRLRMYGITRKEIQELFGTDKKTVTKWLKGMD